MELKEQNIMLNKIRTALAQSGIEPGDITLTKGPTVSLACIGSPAGLTLSRARALEAGICRSIGVSAARAVETGDGFAYEIPNFRKDRVYPTLEEAFKIPGWPDGMELPLFLGYRTDGTAVTLDLAKAPHLLIAGDAGQGKSVCLRSLLSCLIEAKAPGDVKFLFGDPGLINFEEYRALDRNSFYGDGIVFTPSETISHLKALGEEMDRRYGLLAGKRCSNISEYRADGEKMPYIVVVIDEYGYYMSDCYPNKKDFETALIRLAQKGRAVGIHCVILTQRPDTCNMPCLIKVNFPTRLALRCSTALNSRIILDCEGAEKLIGRGDMLLLQDGMLTRLQGIYEDRAGTERVIGKYNSKIPGCIPFGHDNQASPAEDGIIVPVHPKRELQDIAASEDFLAAAHWVVKNGRGSAIDLQRALYWGFKKATNIMDALEEAGIVGPVRGRAPREVLAKDLDELKSIISSISGKQPGE
ncbi:MAG: FtsK/SpoIIIE domain-containing protein [Candidatus Cryptobacteroides sp.]